MNRRKTGVVVVCVAMLAMAVAFAYTGLRDDPATAPSGPAHIGSLAPIVRLDTIDGAHVSIGGGAHVNTPAVLAFGASWCHPCRQEFPILERVRLQHPNVRLYTVMEDDLQAAMRSLMHDTGAKWQALDDVDGVAKAAYGVQGLPVTVFVAANGRITARLAGLGTERRYGDLFAAIDTHSKVLGQKS